jgi:hypothetical protein
VRVPEEVDACHNANNADEQERQPQ